MKPKLKIQAINQAYLEFCIFALFLITQLAYAQNKGEWLVEKMKVQQQAAETQISLKQLNWQNEFRIDDINYICPQVVQLYPQHQCETAYLSLKYDLQTYQATVSSYADFTANAWALSLGSEDRLLKASISSDSPVVEVLFNELDIIEVVKQIIPTVKSYQVPSGVLAGEMQFDLEKMRVWSTTPIQFKGLSYEYSDDIIVAELAGQVEFELDISSERLVYKITLTAGEMLLSDVYVDFSNYPIIIQGNVSKPDATKNTHDWRLLSVEIINTQSLKLNAQVSINDTLQWRHPTVTALVTDSHHFNQQILGSVLGIYGFGGSGMSGQFEVTMNSSQETFDQWSVKFNDFYYLNERRKLVAESLHGQVTWHKNQANENSSLNWQALSLSGIPFNQAAIQFNLSQDQFELIGTQTLPVLDGAVELKEFKLGSLFSDSIDMVLNASMQPISLKLITQNMGWPVMAGTISGDIPGMVKNGSVIEFLGALKLKVFQGDMIINNLSLERLFGVAPVIAADINFNDFDLSLLTETFGFGLITGKLSGTVNELRVTNWKTDRMDAEVYTVKTKGYKQTISQRAIDNISSLGGIKGAISKTFLRFFEDFRYQQIKLSCKLNNSVCEIGGVENQGNQFIIVEGGGIPKINIVGYARSIDWEEFVSRLLNANYDN